ncbi:MAG: DUF3106 domain-containing protein [Gallionella sp.]
MRYFLIGVLLFCGWSNAVFAATPWQSLNATQREALSPLSQQWSHLSEQQQRSLVRMAKHYPTLTPTEKQRFQKKLIAWSALTPEQRKTARERYRSLSKNELAKNHHKQKASIEKQAVKPPSVPAAASGIPAAASAIPPSTNH